MPSSTCPCYTAESSTRYGYPCTYNKCEKTLTATFDNSVLQAVITANGTHSGATEAYLVLYNEYQRAIADMKGGRASNVKRTAIALIYSNHIKALSLSPTAGAVIKQITDQLYCWVKSLPDGGDGACADVILNIVESAMGIVYGSSDVIINSSVNIFNKYSHHIVENNPGCCSIPNPPTLKHVVV